MKKEKVKTMARKNLTQIFPFLLPFRKWQRKHFFYLKMRFDNNRYAKEITDNTMPHALFATSSLMVNENSGFDIKHQMNKVHNLRLAAKALNHVVIKPNETFSFWQLARYADRYQPYKDGLALVNGKIVGDYGGGLCQLSNMLFWMFLHTPMKVVERHGHAVESFPSTTEELPCGTDATINEGWLDLKVKNTTDCSYQIVISFDEEYMYGYIFSNCKAKYDYEIFNQEVTYFKSAEKIYQCASVDCMRTDKKTNSRQQISLYKNTCEIGYELSDDIVVQIKENKHAEEKNSSNFRRMFSRI